MNKNLAIKLINCMFLDNMYDERYDNLKTIAKIEDYNFEWLVNYLSELTVPYNVIENFLKCEITFAEMNGKATGDTSDYLIIDNKGEICACDKRTGSLYYLKDFNKTWKIYVSTEEEKEREAANEVLLESFMGEIFKQMFSRGDINEQNRDK